MEFDLDVSENIAIASTPDKRWYTDEAYYKEEVRRVFSRTWQPVGRSEQLAKPGDFFTCEIAGESVVVLRDNENKLRAYSNVCRHRGALIKSGSGNAKSLQCPYHAWNYQLDGKLAGAPEFEGVQAWNRQDVCLPEYAVQSWGLFVFVHLGKKVEPSLEKLLGKIPGDLESKGYRWSDYQFLARTEYTVNCNWKVYIDNYLEGYHLPTVHPALFRELDYPKYKVETFEYYSSQFAPLRPVNPQNATARRYDPQAGAKEPLYYWVYPNFMLNIYPDNVHINIILPLGHNKTVTLFDWFSTKGNENSLKETISFSDQVQKEDMLICESVQKGLESRDYSRGRYSVKRENGVHHFHRLLQQNLNYQ